MLAVSIDLGKIKVAVRTPNLSLTLSSSCTVVLPPPWTESCSAVELCQASSAGDIWISKAGSCQIEVSTFINDQVPDTESLDPSIMSAVANFASECPVWKHTGLELRTNHASHAPVGQGHAYASYFLHHPDLSSEMIAPTNIPSAQFQGLRCEASYCFKSLKKAKHTKASISNPPATEPLSCAQHTEETPRNHTYSLRNNPRRSKKAAVAVQEEVGNMSPPSTSEPPLPDHRQEDIETLVSEAITDMAYLLDFAFRKLIGVRGISPGMRTIKNSASPPLNEIAPAVWDLQYLQTMSVHAQVIPSIAAGIARLKNARSASLREKINSLAPQAIREDDGQQLADSEADATDEVKNRLWLLCQTRIQPAPMKRPFAPRQENQRTAKKAQSQLEYEGQELEIPTAYMDEDDRDTFVAMEAYSLEPGYEPYIAFPGDLPEANQFEMDLEEPYMPSDGHSSPGDCTHSSEGDYFYTDGHGNVYPIEEENSEDDWLDWAPAPQLVDSDGYSQQQEEDWEGYWGQDANQAYIMSHEDGLPDSGVYVLPDNAANQPFPLSYPDDALSGFWARE